MKSIRAFGALTLVVAMALGGWISVTEAKGPRRPHSAHVPKPKMPRMPHPTNVRSHTNTPHPHPNVSMNSRRKPTTNALVHTQHPRVSGSVGYRSTRHYAASNRYVRGIVSQLRSVHSSLARLDHDYHGNRVRAMHSISTAVRHLSHSSSGSMRPLNVGMRGIHHGSGTHHLPQAQSDARIRMASHRLNLIAGQLQAHGSSSRHYRALGSMQQAQHFLTVALQVR